MNKSELIRRVRIEHKTTMEEAQRIIETVLYAVFMCLSRNESVKLPNFGNFIVKERKSYRTQSPLTRKDIVVAAKTIVAFKPSAILKKSMKEHYDNKQKPRRRRIYSNVGQ